jgi:hypothetical protein
MRGRSRRRSRAKGFRAGTSPVAFAALVSAVLVAAPPARAVQAGQPTVVSAVPASFTPDVNDGTVFAIAQVGPKIILGGTFTSISPQDDQIAVYTQPNVVAFDATTGTIDQTGFLPVVNGKVDTVIPGPRPHQVYIGGSFTQVDGRAMRVALLNTNTGALAPSWHPSSINNTVSKLVLAGGRLYVAGAFTTVGVTSHEGLATVNPTTGKVTPYVQLAFTGHHNYGTKCQPAKRKCAPGETGVKSLDVDPAGTRLVAVGNFTKVSGAARDQVAMLKLGQSSATVDTHWATDAYTARCLAKSFDSYIRDVQFAPDGSYFVIAATGGTGTNSDGTKSSCDSAARYQTDRTGRDVRPLWIDYTGEDSLWTVAVTGTAVYVGGHQRWLNNPHGLNVAGAGAVPRPGLAALSPVSGLPLSWNPGRNPRGAGCFALLATGTGLWIGSDTNYVGNRTYLREKVAFFPLAGGEALPADATPALPGAVYLAGATAIAAPDADRLVYREYDGSTAGPETSLNTSIAWGAVRGTFSVDGEVIYGASDGNLYERTFDGVQLGPETELDPFNDPTWDGVQTGSGQTYQGLPSTFSAEVPTVTSMFFTAGRLYYTLSGQTTMHWRWFEPESGVVGASEHDVSDGHDWSDVAGAFLAGSNLFFADQKSGKLMAVAWTASGATGRPLVADASTDWASRGLFLLSKSSEPTSSLAFSASCTAATCTFEAAPWVDPSGESVTYQWSFGDGTTQDPSATTDASHTYAVSGEYAVTLTAVDADGTSVSTTQQVTATLPN